LKTLVGICILFIATLGVASQVEWEREILKSILHSMKKKPTIAVYTPDSNIQKILEGLDSIVLLKRCDGADFVLLKKKREKVCKKPTVVCDYELYAKEPNAVAVFFWQKGRPTIRFSSKRLKRFGLKVHGELEKFVSTKN
jgi:hypothetical protein